MKKTGILLLFRLVILFEILWGAHAWFTWWIDESRIMQYVFYVLCVIIAYIYKSKKKIRLTSSPYMPISVFFFILGLMFYNRFSLPSLASVILIIYPIIVLASDRSNVAGHLEFVAKGLSLIFIPGIILYVVSQFTFIPGPVIQKGESTSYIFVNQIFQIVSIYEDSIGRFSSIFLEPGYLGTMLSFILYALRYDFSKWYNKVLLITLILSFSLAGYIITLIGYVCIIIFERHSYKRLLFFLFLVLAVYNTATIYNNGDNYINKVVFSRLQYDEDKGIVGNNRTGEGTDFYYNKAIKDGDIWLGLGAYKVGKINAGSAESSGYNTNIRGAGYKVFFVTYGVFSAICFLLFYFFMSIALCKYRIIYRNTFLLLIILTFIQASYPMSSSWIFPFILGLNNAK